MASVLDVAAHVLDAHGPMTTMKLQKLVFYAQARSLATSGRALFAEDFLAWPSGPVAPALYREHIGKFLLRPGELAGAARAGLPPEVAREVDGACEALARLSGRKLTAMARGERPWADARAGLAGDEPGGAVIPKAAMAAYYAERRVWENALADGS